MRFILVPLLFCIIACQGESDKNQTAVPKNDTTSYRPYVSAPSEYDAKRDSFEKVMRNYRLALDTTIVAEGYKIKIQESDSTNFSAATYNYPTRGEPENLALIGKNSSRNGEVLVLKCSNGGEILLKNIHTNSLDTRVERYELIDFVDSSIAMVRKSGYEHSNFEFFNIVSCKKCFTSNGSGSYSFNKEKSLFALFEVDAIGQLRSKLSFYKFNKTELTTIATLQFNNQPTLRELQFKWKTEGNLVIREMDWSQLSTEGNKYYNVHFYHQ